MNSGEVQRIYIFHTKKKKKKEKKKKKKHENHRQKVKISIGYAAAINRKCLIVVGALEKLAG